MDKKQILSLDMVGAVEEMHVKKEISAVELTQTYLGEIAARNDTLNAYITVTADRAMADAEQADKDIAANNVKALTGIPLGIKDLFCTKGIYTTAASKMLADFVPPYESTVTQKLWDAGAVCLGKTNMDEFAMGSTTSTGYHREKKRVVPTINPWSKNSWQNNFKNADGSLTDDALTAGGSSGGSAAAVAGLMALGATGSDTGGSIRQPCAFTGLVGVKPTYGRCSRYGMVAFASSLDQAGVMTRSVRDAALMLEVIAGYDKKDSTSANAPVIKGDWSDKARKGRSEGLKGLRVAVMDYDNFSLEVKDIVETTKSTLNKDIIYFYKDTLNADKVDGLNISINASHIVAYYIIAPAEAASNLARYDGVRYGLRSDGKNLNDMYENTRHDGFGDEVKRRILIGNYVLSAGYYDAYFKKAQQVRRKIVDVFSKIFREYDVIFMPTTITAPFALNRKFIDATEIYKEDLLTIPISLAGLPAGIVPNYIGLTENGQQQVVCNYYKEDILFQAMGALEDRYAREYKSDTTTTDNLLKINGQA